MEDENTPTGPLGLAQSTLKAIVASVAALTSAATLIGWVASDDFIAVARIALMSVGALATAFFALVVARVSAHVVARLVTPQKRRKDQAHEPEAAEDGVLESLAVVVFFGALVGYVVFKAAEGRWGTLIGLGAVIFGVGLATGVIMVNESRTARTNRSRLEALAAAASRKTCPDCAEEVRARAEVCRYCGFRFDDGDAEVRWA